MPKSNIDLLIESAERARDEDITERARISLLSEPQDESELVIPRMLGQEAIAVNNRMRRLYYGRHFAGILGRTDITPEPDTMYDSAYQGVRNPRFINMNREGFKLPFVLGVQAEDYGNGFVSSGFEISTTSKYYQEVVQFAKVYKELQTGKIRALNQPEDTLSIVVQHYKKAPPCAYVETYTRRQHRVQAAKAVFEDYRSRHGWLWDCTLRMEPIIPSVLPGNRLSRMTAADKIILSDLQRDLQPGVGWNYEDEDLELTALGMLRAVKEEIGAK